MVKILTHTLMLKSYDLVVVLVPRWDILNELLKRLPGGLKPVVLKPRPGARCGDLNETWTIYEGRGLGLLGRSELCGSCPRRIGCRWPGQYGSRLRGVRLILATQQHLTLNPAFLLHLQQQTRANSALVLIDESNLLIRPTDRILSRADLDMFVAAQQALAQNELVGIAREWLERSRILTMASTVDLRAAGWIFPPVGADCGAAVQSFGRDLFGDEFRFLGYDLHHLAHSEPSGRERLPSGDIRFSALPYLGQRFMVFSGSMGKDLARFRLDPNYARPSLDSPFAGYRFEHPETRWYNLNSLLGAARYFPKNAGPIIDFFARLVARNIAVGKAALCSSVGRST